MKDFRQGICTKTGTSGRVSTVTFESFGARISLRCADRRILEDLKPFLPPCSTVIGSRKADAIFLIQREPKRRDGLVLQASHGFPETELAYRTLEELASEFHFAVSLFARPYLFVHAGVVVLRGQAIVLPGRSMSGKSTLVSALVALGATYYSDEYAVIDGRGRVHPYPKALALRIRGVRDRRFESQPVSAANGQSTPLGGGVVAFLKYKADSLWNPRRLTPAEAVLALLENTVAAQARSGFALRALSALARRVTSIKGLRPDISIAVPALAELVSDCAQVHPRRGMDV
jgi:hypothetical protein